MIINAAHVFFKLKELISKIKFPEKQRKKLNYVAYLQHNNRYSVGTEEKMAARDNDDWVQRLINLVHVIRLLGQDNGTTITEITEKTGLSRWTVMRMIDRLTGAGLEVKNIENQTDKRKNYLKVDKDSLWTMTLPDIALEEKEKELFSFLLRAASDVPVLCDSAQSLRSKIKWVDNMPSSKIINIQRPGKKINPNTAETVKLLLDSIGKKQWIRFEYYNLSYDENREYTVKPVYLFIFEGSLYLRCITINNGYYINYALERFVGLPEPVKPQHKIEVDDSDIEKLTSDPFGPFPSEEPFEAVIHLDLWQGYYAELINWPDTCSIEEQEDGTYILKVTTANRFGLIQWIMQQGADATVISPARIREEVIELMKKTLSNYGELYNENS